MRVRIAAILSAAILAFGAFAVTRPGPHLGPASAGAPITSDGYSRFTPNGHKYFTEHGEVVIEVGHPATVLALPSSGASRFALVPPLTVKVIDSDGATQIVKDVRQMLMFTARDRVTSITLTTAADEVVEFSET